VLVLDFFVSVFFSLLMTVMATALNLYGIPVMRVSAPENLVEKTSTACSPSSHLCSSMLFHEKEYIFFFFEPGWCWSLM
ncbi:hypothetical protein V4Y02_23480, partial [Escherichia coli]